MYADAYAASRSSSWSSEPPGVLEVRETNFCRVFAAADEHTGKVIVFGAIDNLWKGTSSQALQNLNLMFGLPRQADSRAPPNEATAAQRSSARAGSPARRTCASWGSTPGCRRGFRAAGVAAGSSRAAGRDVGLLVCDSPTPVSAARFTRARRRPRRCSSAASAARLDALRAVLANSGCANAATGRRGLDDAAKTQGAAAIAAGVECRRGAVASTGAISHDAAGRRGR